MSTHIQVVTTIDSKEIAEKIATTVIELQLAACVQISNCLSMYRWQGEVERAGEFLCVMKSRMDLFPDLEGAIRSVHTYEVPEILATEIKAGGYDYLAWLDQELRPEDEG
jgi:periplasmic divalent cation tolerance protein